MMVLDECPKLTKDKKVLSKAIEVSTHWAKEVKQSSVIINLKHYWYCSNWII